MRSGLCASCQRRVALTHCEQNVFRPAQIRWGVIARHAPDPRKVHGIIKSAVYSYSVDRLEKGVGLRYILHIDTCIYKTQV